MLIWYEIHFMLVLPNFQLEFWMKSIAFWGDLLFKSFWNFYWIFSPHWTFHLMHILLTDACKIFMMSATNRCCGQVAIFACRFLQISAKILISICLDFSSVNNFFLFDIGISFWNFYIIKRLFKKTFEDENRIFASQTWLYLSPYNCLYRKRNYTSNT